VGVLERMKKIKYPLIGMVLIMLIFSTIASLGSNVTDNKNSEVYIRNPCSMGPELDVTTDKKEYNIGEPVTIFLTNIGDEILSAGGPIITIYDEDEEIVYQEGTYCWHELDPGEYIEWLPWDQTNQQGQQVPVGKYVAEGFLSGVSENYVDTETFFIINYNPPDPPFGPNEGVVGEEYSFCFELTDNTECEPYYVIWDWGDDTLSDWGGPYVAGETVCSNHSWNQPGDYEIRVGIKDSCGNAYWSDPLTITINIITVTEIEIEISDYFKNTNPIVRYYHGVQIENVGDETAIDVAVDFWVSGGIFSKLREVLKMRDYWEYGCGKILSNEKGYCPICLNWLYLGNIEMTAKVWANNAKPVTKTLKAFASVGFIWVTS